MVSHAEPPSYGRALQKRAVSSGRAQRGFWHQPWLMNIASNVLLFLVLGVFLFAGFKASTHYPIFDLTEVVVTQPLKEVSAEQLEYAASSVRGNFFTADLEQARQIFEKLPWVRHADLRRRWPSRIEVTLDEHEAIAYWQDPESSDVKLLDKNALIFEGSSTADMPVFQGSPETASLMINKFESMNKQLEPIHQRIKKLTLSNRLAWKLALEDGTVIELGKEQEQLTLAQRIERLVAAYPQVVQKFEAKPSVIDLRYPSGFSVRLATTSEHKR